MERCTELVKKELQKLKSKSLGSLYLHQAKTQFNGQISLAEENRMNVMLMLGKNLVQNFPIETLEEVIHKINRISAKDILETAHEIFDFDRMSYLAFVSD